MLVTTVPIRHDRLEPSTITGANLDLDPLAHAGIVAHTDAQRDSYDRVNALGSPIGERGSCRHHARVSSLRRLRIRPPRMGLVVGTHQNRRISTSGGQFPAIYIFGSAEGSQDSNNLPLFRTD
jgi:hypothetical protein